VSTVLAAQTGPRGAAAGVITLPNTGRGGGDSDGTDRLLAMLALVAGVASLTGIMALKQRRR